MKILNFGSIFASFSSVFYAWFLQKMEVILTFWIFFQKWSLILKIRNGEASRLYVNLLPRSWRHQKAHFQDSPSTFWRSWKYRFWAVYVKVTSGRPEVDFKKVLQNVSISSKMDSKHSGGVAKWFGTDFGPAEWFWSNFTKIHFQRHLEVNVPLFLEIQESILLVV